MTQKQQIKILIVEDEVKIAEVVQAYLNKSGYTTLVAYDGRSALEQLERETPQLVILDRMLPYVSGEEICQAVRRRSRIPVIMLTAKVDEEDRIAGLDMGADDYITKPFSPRELVARVNSLLRRCDAQGAPLFSVTSWNKGDLQVDFDAHLVKKQGRPVPLTHSEYQLFALMAKRPNKVFTREELIDSAFGLEFGGYDRTIDSHIKNLRAKIEDDSSAPRYIHTVRGVGYRFGGDGA